MANLTIGNKVTTSMSVQSYDLLLNADLKVYSASNSEISLLQDNFPAPASRNPEPPSPDHRQVPTVYATYTAINSAIFGAMQSSY